MAEQEAVTQIDRIAAETIIVQIVGTAPLITNRMSEKAKRMMLAAMVGDKLPKEPKDPKAEFEAAAYRMGDDYGISAISFKNSTVSAARYYGKNQVSMVGLRQFIFIGGEIGNDGITLVKIQGKDESDGDWPVMREDAVTVGRGGTDLRYRPAFWPWRVALQVTFVTSALTRNSVLSLIDAGGLGVGVGEWRPEKKGDFGTYKIDVDKEIEVITN